MVEGKKILVLGAGGQIGSDLVEYLRKVHGADNVIASDVRDTDGKLSLQGPFELIDVLDSERILKLVHYYGITEIYHLAAMLSANAEKRMRQAWDLNIDGLINVLEIVRYQKSIRLFWPSSIAVFGPSTPKRYTPQKTIMEPSTIYGISKLAGERWCEYYHTQFGVDVRSLRYPGVVSYKSPPGGGTTDYAVEIFHKALDEGTYNCFLSEHSTLPMMYMPDVIKATTALMNAEERNVRIRSSYNLAALSFSPLELANEISNHIKDFYCRFQPDFRQKIADSWPQTIDDSDARNDWQWQEDYDLAAMTADMILNLQRIKKEQKTGQSHS